MEKKTLEDIKKEKLPIGSTVVFEVRKIKPGEVTAATNELWDKNAEEVKEAEEKSEVKLETRRNLPKNRIDAGIQANNPRWGKH